MPLTRSEREILPSPRVTWERCWFMSAPIMSLMARKNEPYVEDDAPLPLNVYGNSKLAGEHFARTLNPEHFVLRTSALYGKHPCRAKGGLNFVDLMLKLARERGKVRVVDDEFVTPTSTSQLAKQIVF